MEPYHIDPEDSDLTTLPPAIRQILENFQKYKTDTINSVTLQSQSPNLVFILKDHFIKVARALVKKLYEIPLGIPIEKGSKLEAFIESVTPLFQQVPVEKRPVIVRWIEIVFAESSYTENLSHIVQNLAKNYDTNSS